MPYACKICVMQKGLKGSDLKSLFQTEEELYDHLEKEHGFNVQDEVASFQKSIDRLLERTMTFYILDERGRPAPERDMLKWAKWFGAEGTRFVSNDQIGGSRVSTIFLGIDHNFSTEGPPVLWETMVFGGALNEEMDRCSGSREQAEAMHARMVKKVKASLCQKKN